MKYLNLSLFLVLIAPSLALAQTKEEKVKGYVSAGVSGVAGASAVVLHKKLYLPATVAVDNVIYSGNKSLNLELLQGIANKVEVNVPTEIHYNEVVKSVQNYQDVERKVLYKQPINESPILTEDVLKRISNKAEAGTKIVIRYYHRDMKNDRGPRQATMTLESTTQAELRAELLEKMNYLKSQNVGKVKYEIDYIYSTKPIIKQKTQTVLVPKVISFEGNKKLALTHLKNLENHEGSYIITKVVGKGSVTKMMLQKGVAKTIGLATVVSLGTGIYAATQLTSGSNSKTSQLFDGSRATPEKKTSSRALAMKTPSKSQNQ